MKVYLVRAAWGEYSDAGECIEHVFSKREKAIEYIKGRGIGVYDDGDYTYACWPCDEPMRTVYPTWNGSNWAYEGVQYSLDTPWFDVIEMEVDA